MGFYKMKSDKIIKKCFISIVTFMCMAALPTAGFCSDYITAKLNDIEKNYYGYTTKGSTESRLLKLEQTLYGTIGKGNQKSRVDKIYKDLNIETNTQSVTGGASAIEQKTLSKNIGPKADTGIKYPVVDKLEQKVFSKAYTNDDIYIRLSRLEKQVFKKESTLSLNERVDALRNKVLGGEDTVAVNINPDTEEIILENGKKYIDDSQYNYYSYENSKNKIREQENSLSPDITDFSNFAPKYEQSYDLDILEKQMFGKRFTQESFEQRLARLESKVFQRTFNDDFETRTQRLLAVTTAQKTSKEYDSNKWAQRINTGIQIGSILLMVLAMIL